MGGHVAGEVASRVAVEAIEVFIQETAGADKNRTWPFPFEPALSLEANRLKAAFRLANRRIASAIADSHDLRGMATTASALLTGPDGACVAHVGDSRVYVLKRRPARSRSPTIIPGSKSRCAPGTMSPTAARQHPWRNVVTRALSGGEDPEVDVTAGPARPGPSAICSARTACSRSSPTSRSPRCSGDRDVPLEELCQRLIDAANTAGGPDNITALVLEVNAP